MAEIARRPRRSLRARITLGAAAAVAAGLVIGALAFYFTLSATLTAGVRALAEQDAQTIAAQIDAGGLGDFDDDSDSDDDSSGHVSSGDGSGDGSGDAASEQLEALLDVDDARYAQIIADDGTVLASEPSSIPQGDRFISATAEADGDITVVAGRSAQQLTETLATVGLLLALSVPLLVALVAAITWIVVGRALAPVDRMRSKLESVTAADLGQRIEEPGGGTSDEIGRLAHTMNGMLDRLEAAQRAQRRFISDASHELKSPLASLRQYAEVAKAHPERIGAAELSEAVLDEGARLEQLVANMLVLARTDEGALPLVLADVDLDDIVLAEATRLRGLGTAVDSSRVGAARVHGDLALLRQLVRNLADNAARHASTTVVFELRSTAGDVTLLVRDDGDGIPESERTRVFERFVRLDDARSRASGGSGLGLAIVAEITRAHGGTIAVGAAEPPGHGAVFELRMPAAP